MPLRQGRSLVPRNATSLLLARDCVSTVALLQRRVHACFGVASRSIVWLHTIALELDKLANGCRYSNSAMHYPAHRSGLQTPPSAEEGLGRRGRDDPNEARSLGLACFCYRLGGLAGCSLKLLSSFGAIVSRPLKVASDRWPVLPVQGGMGIDDAACGVTLRA